jgi:mannosyl-oligosaccharide alpha-1,2-mannosidase
MTLSVFETTIRYLGGLLSTYELTGKKFPALVDRARELGDKLAFAFSLVSLAYARDRRPA